MSIDRYADAGMRMNPFATELTSLAARELFVDRGLPDPPAAGAATLVQVIGEKGAGKTTQVLAWRQRTDGAYHYVPRLPYRSRWARPPVASIVYADEIDRMPVALRWSWFRRLARASSTVVVGTHVDLSAVAQRAGLHVTSHVLGPASPAFLGQVFDRRFDYVAGPQRTAIRFAAADIEAIHRQSDGSLRKAEVIGHEMVADRTRARVAIEPSGVKKVAQ